MMAEQASSSKAVSNTVEDALAPKAMKRKYTSSPKLLTPLKMTAERASSQRERLDVFQNEIVIAFADITSFKKFAQSKNGLCLDQAVIQTIVDDNERNEVEQKLGMLFKWQEIKGEKATAPKIRDLLQKYFRKDNPSDYLVLENGIFGVYKTVFLSKRSSVYLGVQISEISGTQTRAIKFFPKNKTNLREAQILVKLGNHVNVVSIIHAGIHRGDPQDYIYIAMERSWTQTVRNMLKECIKQEKPFHEFIAWSLVEQLMRAVEFLHSHNIIHRDLKPENILASDNWRHFKVTDFGLSKEIQDGFATNQTNANTGTEGYRSRETYDPNAKITAKADIFSAGVTIGEIMANGKHPFGNDKYLWSHHIINNKNLDLSHLCVSYKDQVTYFIKRMLEMDPEKRPTAKEVLNDVLIYFQAFQLKNQQTTAEESLGTTSKAITELSITEKEHLEDVFQDEIIKAFPDITGFKEFAQSKNGLYLDEHVIQQIVEDHKGSVEEQKLQMLQKWAENQEGKATVGKIRYLLQKYLGDQSSTGYIVLENGRYRMYKNYVLSKRAQVFLGQQISEVTGSYICAIKLQQNNSKNLKEAKILSKLRNHVNVVSILHAGIYRSDPYDYIFIAMELSWTDTVRDMLEESDRLAIPFNEFISMNLVKQILRALDFIHSNNIIHRDLKPENVLLSKDWSHSKVTDFGISKTITDGRSTRQTSENIGTDGYRAHETYITNVRISLKADIFSAGVTIAEIFSNGKHPFGSNPYLWSNNIINNQNLDLSHLCVSNKDQIISLIKRMLEVDPDQRPTSREVLNEVDKFQTLSQPKNQRTTADQSLAPASIAELLIKEKENVIIMFNYSDKHMYSISFKAKKWSRMQECDIDSYFGTAVVSGRHLYILQNQKVYQLEYSDPTAKWQQMSSMNEDHGEYPPVAVLNGFIYVCGGSGIYDASRSVHRYDPPLDRWEHMCDMNIIRTNSCVVASEDHIYCVGGWDGRSVERFDGRSVERFDERSNEWEFVKSAPRLVMDASAAVVKNWIYLADHEGLLCYDIQNDSWSEIETKEWSFVKGWLVKILAVDEKLYVIGRMTESSPITAIYLLKRENGQMTLIEEFEGKYLNLHACLAVELNLHAYLDQASYIFTAV